MMKKIILLFAFICGTQCFAKIAQLPIVCHGKETSLKNSIMIKETLYGADDRTDTLNIENDILYKQAFVEFLQAFPSAKNSQRYIREAPLYIPRKSRELWTYIDDEIRKRGQNENIAEIDELIQNKKSLIISNINAILSYEYYLTHMSDSLMAEVYKTGLTAQDLRNISKAQAFNIYSFDSGMGQYVDGFYSRYKETGRYPRNIIEKSERNKDYENVFFENKLDKTFDKYIGMLPKFKHPEDSVEFHDRCLEGFLSNREIKFKSLHDELGSETFSHYMKFYLDNPQLLHSFIKGFVSQWIKHIDSEASDLVGSQLDLLYKMVTSKQELSSEYGNNVQTEGKDSIFEVVTEDPMFPGGEMAMKAWLSKNLRYPAKAQDAGVMGRVLVQFVVDIYGQIEPEKVVKTLDDVLAKANDLDASDKPEDKEKAKELREGVESIEKEAMRIISSMPEWIPGMYKGKPARVRYTMPIMFRLK